MDAIMDPKNPLRFAPAYNKNARSLEPFAPDLAYTRGVVLLSKDYVSLGVFHSNSLML